MNEKDRKRCEKDFLRCLGIVAIKLIQQAENPYTLTENEIESNGTARKKTLRLLSEAGKIHWSGYTGRRYSTPAEKFNFKRQFENVARSYEQKPEFPSVPSEINSAWRTAGTYGEINTTQEDINDIGYLPIEIFKPEERIYLWFHLNEYMVNRKAGSGHTYSRKKERITVFPRQKLDQRKTQAMRGIFKKYAEPLLMPWLSEKFDINLEGFDNYTNHPEDTEKYKFLTHYPLNVSLRSCMRFPVAFNDLAFKGPKGYLPEYTEKLLFIQRKTGVMRSLVTKVKSYGYEKLMKEFVEYAKGYLLSDAPLKLIDEEEAGAGHMILSNLDLITFENMFGGHDECERQSQVA